MDDNDFDEIEQFLADGGEPPEPTPEELARMAYEVFREAVQPTVDAVMEWAQTAWDAVAEIARQWLDNVVPLFRKYFCYWRPQRIIYAAMMPTDWKMERWRIRWLPLLMMPPPKMA